MRQCFICFFFSQYLFCGVIFSCHYYFTHTYSYLLNSNGPIGQKNTQVAILGFCTLPHGPSTQIGTFFSGEKVAGTFGGRRVSGRRHIGCGACRKIRFLAGQYGRQCRSITPGGAVSITILVGVQWAPISSIVKQGRLSTGLACLLNNSPLESA